MELLENGEVSRAAKTLVRVLQGTSDNSVSFKDLCGLLERVGFVERVKGSHHIFVREDIVEILNLQPKRNKAKPYQVRQVRELILRYGLSVDDMDDKRD